MPRPYRTWGYPVVPILFLLASVGMVVNALITEPRDTGITFAIILAGVPAYYAWKAWSGGTLTGEATELAVDKRK
jgi:APA family basic amino acid/polyamine antiporter